MIHKKELIYCSSLDYCLFSSIFRCWDLLRYTD